MDVLARAARKVIESAEHTRKVEEMGTTAYYRSPEQFAKFWADAEDQFKPIVELAIQ